MKLRLALCVLLGLAVLGVTQSAFAGSDKYRLSWTSDPATSMTIGWCQTSGDAYGVKFGTDPALATYTTQVLDETRTYDNTSSAEGDPLVSYFCDLAGLQPDTVYYFRTYDSEGDNTIYWFKTAPNTPKAVTFISGGDSRTHQEPRQWGNTLVSKLRPLFVAFGGDYHDDCTNDEMREWLDDWQLTISSDNRMYPIIPSHGNHENDMTEFVQLIFNMPNADGYYAASVGGTMMRLYSLNTELEPGVGYGAFTNQDDTKWNDQANWLAADMAANPGYTWKIGQFHRPMRPHQSDKSEGTGRIDAWARTMYDNGMDLVIDCDSHLVKYTYPVAPSEDAGSYESFVRDDAAGTMFIGEGSWGAPHRANDDDKPWTLSSDTFWQFKLIQANADNIFIRTVKFGQYDADGTPALGYDMADVAELTQSAQDTDAFAVPEGLDAILWKPLAGTVVTLNATGDLFIGAEINNVEYVSTGADWKYLDDGSDQGTDWSGTGFDDSAWASGDAQLGYGDGDETTVISYGDDADNKHITAYFRKTFTVADAAKVIKLKVMMLRDDGAVLYINGNEAARSSMPDGDITYTTLANDAGSETTYYEYNIDPSLLVTGSNTVAVEVHQSGGTSSDTSFDLVLYAVESNTTGTAPADPTALAQADVTTTTIDLSWTDNAGDEVGYELWRKTADGAWEILEPSLAADTASYGDTMLNEGSTYTYKVRAFNAAGLSAFSDELAVTTAVASTPLVYGEDFNTGSFGQFTTVSVTSSGDSADWHAYEYPTGSGDWFARINGYGADEASNDWLISPELNLYAYEGEYVTADLAYNYSGPEIEVLVSDNYDPEVHANPGDAHWITMGAAMPTAGSYTFETTGALKFDLAAADFDIDFGSFTPYSVASNADWVIQEQAGKVGAVANGFGADEAGEDWLISPAFTVGAGSEIEIAFNLYRKYGGPELQVMVSTDYAGSGDPNLATWESYSIAHDDVYDAWKNVSLTHEFDSDATVYVAFLYTTTGTGSGDGARIGVDDVVIQPTKARVAFHYISTGTGGGDGRVWEVDNFEFRANQVSYLSEDFDQDLITASSFTVYSVASDADWILQEQAGQQGAVANGYGADGASDDWLISPAMLLAASECSELTFDFYHKYGGPELQVMISTDYDGASDPTSFTWDAVTVEFDADYYDDWKPVTVDLCDYAGTVYVAFRYTSTGTGSGEGARIGVDNVQVVRKVSTAFSVNFTAGPDTVTTHDAEVGFTAYVNGGAEPYTYAWTFGNGDASTDANPVYTYTNAGVYSVALCATDADGIQACSSKTNLITVKQGTTYALPEKAGDLRVATFNCYLNRTSEGQIVTDLGSGTDAQIQKVAEIIQRVNPDVILLNEFDYVADGSALELLKEKYLAVSQNGADPIAFPYSFIAESNTGIESGHDFNNDGSTESGGDDCYGYGDFYGQYGMAFLSKYPIDEAKVRTFQKFLWKDMTDSNLPTDYYDTAEQDIFRLSSKSHWDIPVTVNGETVHLLCAHPTPPTFDDGDADEDDSLFDWNGKRNHDEIRFWADYVSPGLDGYIYDDDNLMGGIDDNARFVILGDQNADPDEGDSYQNAIVQLLDNENINSAYVPVSTGGVDYGIDEDDTASWAMRADYALPSAEGFAVEQGGVFWPTHTDDVYYLVDSDASSDHRLVWIDLTITSDTVEGDLDGDGDVDRDDIAVIRSHLRDDAAACQDCDIDGDGTITIRDARLAMGMCTLSRCARP
jgi:PKD repeat protein